MAYAQEKFIKWDDGEGQRQVQVILKALSLASQLVISFSNQPLLTEGFFLPNCCLFVVVVF